MQTTPSLSAMILSMRLICRNRHHMDEGFQECRNFSQVQLLDFPRVAVGGDLRVNWKLG
jgi:hypothetical protein